VIAIDIPYGVYAAYQGFFREAFIAAVSSVLGEVPYSVYVTYFARSTVGTTLIYYDNIIAGTDYDVYAASTAVKSLFNMNASACSATTPVGCPAFSPLVAAFGANGLPAPAAYYNDQFVASVYQTPPDTTVNVSKVGTWRAMDSNEVVAVDIEYMVYATQQQYYKKAFIAAMAHALGVSTVSVFVNDFQRSSAGTTNIYFDIELDATTSTFAVSATFVSVQNLFSRCNAQLVGCRAGSNSTLVQLLRQYGLPVCNAYYNDQLSPTQEVC